MTKPTAATIHRMLARKGDGLRRGPAGMIVAGDSFKGTAVGRKEADPDISRYSGLVARRLRQLRKAKGLTPQEMAEKLLALKSRAAGLAEKNPLKAAIADLPDDAERLVVRIRHYESGRADLPQDLFPAWAKVLGVGETGLLPGR